MHEESNTLSLIINDWFGSRSAGGRTKERKRKIKQLAPLHIVIIWDVLHRTYVTSTIKSTKQLQITMTFGTYGNSWWTLQATSPHNLWACFEMNPKLVLLYLNEPTESSMTQIPGTSVNIWKDAKFLWNSLTWRNKAAVMDPPPPLPPTFWMSAILDFIRSR